MAHDHARAPSIVYWYNVMLVLGVWPLLLLKWLVVTGSDDADMALDCGEAEQAEAKRESMELGYVVVLTSGLLLLVLAFYAAVDPRLSRKRSVRAALEEHSARSASDARVTRVPERARGRSVIVRVVDAALRRTMSERSGSSRVAVRSIGHSSRRRHTEASGRPSKAHVLAHRVPPHRGMPRTYSGCRLPHLRGRPAGPCPAPGRPVAGQPLHPRENQRRRPTDIPAPLPA